MEIEQSDYKEASLSSGKSLEESSNDAAAAQEVDNSTPEPAKLAETTPKVEEKSENEPITASNIKEKALKYSKNASNKGAQKTIQDAKEHMENEQKAQYKLNPKYNALGKEYELPKWMQESIKDATSEKEIKEVFEKAMGLEHVKTRHQELHGKFVETQNQYNALSSEVDSLRKIYQDSISSGNLLGLDDFFGKLQVPTEVLLQYLNQKIQFEELPPEQKQMFMSAQQVQRRNRELEMQTQILESQSSQASTQARSMQLQQVLASPDVAPIVQNFDSASGRKSGDFWNLVREHGEYVWYKSGGKTDLTPEQAVAEVIKKYGLYPQPVQNTHVVNASPVAEQAQKTPTVAPHRDVPTLPTVKSKNTSPVQQKFRSMDEVRKYYKDNFANK